MDCIFNCAICIVVSRLCIILANQRLRKIRLSIPCNSKVLTFPANFCNLSRDLGGEDSVPCPFTGMNRYCSLHTEKSFLEHGIEHQLSGTLEKDIMTSTVLLFTFSSYLGKTTYNSIGLPSIPPRPIFRRAKPLYVNRFRSSKQENKSKESKVVFFEVMDREWYM